MKEKAAAVGEKIRAVSLSYQLYGVQLTYEGICRRMGFERQFPASIPTWIGPGKTGPLYEHFL